MKTLIIYAHPNTEGHNSTILKEVKANLKEQKQTFEVINLYKDKFDPVLSEEELVMGRKKKPTVQIKKYQEKIKQSKQLILIYPIWWGSMPAILKGFIDRVLSAGFAFKYVNGRPVGLLKGKIAKIFITTGGPKIIYKFLGNVPKRSIKTSVMMFCGIKTKVYHMGGCQTLDDKKISKIRIWVKKALKNL